MSHFQPNHHTRLGSYLQQTMISDHPRENIPIFQINSKKVPVFSTLTLGSNQFRMIGLTLSPFSPPVSSIRSPNSSLCVRDSQRIDDVQVFPQHTLQQMCESDETMNEDGLMTYMEFDHSNSYFRASANTYELLSHFSRLTSYVQCSKFIHAQHKPETDLSTCYDRVPIYTSRLELRYPQYSPLNSRYESVVRFICGSDLVKADDIELCIETLQCDFHQCLLKENYGKTTYQQLYMLHLHVSKK